MMQTISIDQFETRLRIPRRALDQRKRLDGILRPILDGLLEETLDRVGISPHEEVCIREVRVPVRLQLARSDSELALQWSLALAAAIQQAVQGRETEWVVRFGSRRHALIDFAVGVARGDLRREWAWRQLGFTTAALSAATAPGSLQRTLVNEPTSIVPVLRGVAQQNEFGRLWRRLEPSAWSVLAAAALKAGGGNAAWILSEDVPDFDVQPAAGAAATLRRSLSRSPLAQAIASGAPWADVRHRALAALACLDVEPGLLQRGTDIARTHVQTTIELLLEMTRSAEQLSEVRALPDTAASRPASPNANDASQVQPDVADDDAWPLAADQIAGQTSDRVGTPATGLETATTPDDLAICREPLNEPIEQDRVMDPGDTDKPQPLPEVRRRAVTEYGGLLLLVPMLSELEFCRQIAGNPALEGRSLPWLLHQLAMQLVSIDETDPAALALAGLVPGDEPPSADEPPATKVELAELASWANRIVQLLPLRLDQPQRSGAVLLEWLCRRRAEVVADPGWIEVHFSLDDASTELRRSGLDLDPGFVPWLGVVICFVYE